MTYAPRPFAIVTGAACGVGYELARRAAQGGFDLLLADREPSIVEAAQGLATVGVNVDAAQADLSTLDGVEELHGIAEALGRPVDALLVTAGQGMGRAFVDRDFSDAMDLIDVNITGPAYLVHRFARDMVRRERGRILIAGGVDPHADPADVLLAASQAFLASLAVSMQREVGDRGVSVTYLAPPALARRAGRLDAAILAQAGFDAMMRGEPDVPADRLRPATAPPI